MRFFATVQIWTSKKGDLKRTVEGKERVIGSTVQLDIQKNRISGWDGQVTAPFHRSVGVDETGACVDYLVEELWGKDKKGIIKAPEFDFEGRREDLIRLIEKDDAEDELRSLVRRTWAEIEEKSAVVRKSRYD